MKNTVRSLAGHIMALAAICVWGSTFIFSKVLLEAFTPIQIMTMRFVIAYIVLWCMYPKIEKTTPKDEMGFFAMSLFGNTVYFLCENNALRYTLASNVSIIVASAPIWTAILAHFVYKSKLSRNILWGFLLAFAGVALVVFNGTVVLKFNPLGDMLSLAAAVSWAVYSVLVVRYINKYSSFYLMRRLTLYGLATSVPLLFITSEYALPFAELLVGRRMFSIIFLGVLGSGVSYVLWNMATRKLGIIKVSNYIYVNPFVTLITAGIFLGEPITLMGVAGAVMIIGGVIVGIREKRPADGEPADGEPAAAEQTE